MTPLNKPQSPPPGLVAGGRGGRDDELLIDGQEEVFSRSEVELGRIEHDTATDFRLGMDHRRKSDLPRNDARQFSKGPGRSEGQPKGRT